MKRVSKESFILDRCRGKDVLDLGAVETRVFREKGIHEAWLHDKIRKTARTVIAIDNDRESVEKLQQLGYRFIYGDVEHMHDLIIEIPAWTLLNFDLIVAGDLIEHLSNPGLFLESVKQFMNPCSQLIVTTPNCFSFYYLRRFIAGYGWEDIDPTHTHWHSMRTLCQMLKRHGYEIVDKEYNYTDQKLNGIRPALRLLFKRIFKPMSHTLLVSCKLKD